VLTIQNTEHFRIESPTIVTIGTFDGVHLGHQKILDRLKALKEQTGLMTVVLTFGPHPRKVLFPEQTDLKLLTVTDEKLELLERYGVDVTVVYPFSRDFAALDPRQYVENILVKSLKVKQLVIGYDHRFGSERKGDIGTLRDFAPAFGYSVEEISRRDVDDIGISSSKIRKALEEGNLPLATEYLGHNYFLHGTVIEGKKLGRTLGYPTANIRPEGEDKLIPATGVYFVEAFALGQSYYGMMSIGYNPTTDTDRNIKCEVHLFGFDKDLYGKPIAINFLKRIRDEKKFANLTELKLALDEDKRRCAEWINDF
jgi:riboflavin kinase / FMN adenylyltransferase